MLRLILSVLLGAGLAFGGQVSPQLAQPFALRVGGKAYLNTEGLEVRVLGVQDSRCPKGATCVVAGEAKVKLGLRVKGKSLGTLELTLSAAPTAKNTGHLGSYYLRLLEVAPHPDTNTVSKPAQTVRLEVRKTPFR